MTFCYQTPHTEMDCQYDDPVTLTIINENNISEMLKTTNI